MVFIEGGVCLRDHLARDPTSVMLLIHQRRVTVDDLHYIHTLVNPWQKVIFMNCSFASVTTEELFISSMARMTTLVHVDVSHTTFYMPWVVVAFCRSLALLHNLKYLALANCKLPKEAAKGLADLLDLSPQLCHLELSYNVALGETCPILFMAVGRHPQLQHLSIDSMGWGKHEVAIDAICKMIATTRSLRYLGLGHNGFLCSMGDRLAECLQHNTTLNEVNLLYNHALLRPRFVQALLRKTMATNTTLHMLQCTPLACHDPHERQLYHDLTQCLLHNRRHYLLQRWSQARHHTFPDELQETIMLWALLWVKSARFQRLLPNPLLWRLFYQLTPLDVELPTFRDVRLVHRTLDCPCNQCRDERHLSTDMEDED